MSDPHALCDMKIKALEQDLARVTAERDRWQQSYIDAHKVAEGAIARVRAELAEARAKAEAWEKSSHGWERNYQASSANYEVAFARAEAEEARAEGLAKLVGDAQDFLKHLLAGKSQYEFNGKLMANGMVHARELDEHIRAALAAGRGLDNDDDNLATWRAERDDGRGTGE